jgi:sortase A
MFHAGAQPADQTGMARAAAAPTLSAVDWRRVLRGIGKTFITTGVLILLFVAYQLWGTGLAEARSQRSLEKQFATSSSAPTSIPFSSNSDVPAVTPTTTAATPPVVGNAVGIIDIKKIGVHKAIVEGVALANLQRGPGHYPGTPMPGQPGNAAIAGHRTTYGAPFFRLDELAPGDPIVVTTQQGQFTYYVQSTKAVSPNDVSVVDPTNDNRLTLTTCTPRFTASQRLVVSAVLGPNQTIASAPPPAPANDGKPATVLPGDSDPGLAGDANARGPVVLWGLISFAAGFLIWLAGRRWKRWIAYPLGSPLMVVVLFLLFENINRLLPANI